MVPAGLSIDPPSTIARLPAGIRVALRFVFVAMEVGSYDVLSSPPSMLSPMDRYHSQAR